MPYCKFIPPFVEKEVEKHSEAPAADEQAALDKGIRARRATAIEAAPAGVAEAVAGAAPDVLPILTGGVREVYDSENTNQQRKTLVRAEGDPATADADVSFAYDFAGFVRTFFAEVLERDSIDNSGLKLILNVHYGNKYNNAFWDGDEMTFGDGDGVIFSGFARSLDVVAHELAHGVTQFTAALIYKNQSGALNEHFSDVFGTAITQWVNDESPTEADWLIGDEIMGPQLYGEALRSMAHPGLAYDNPILGKDPQPAHYDNRYQGSADNGGVHINSGIPNRAFYLAAMELGSTIVATKIWYHALQHLPNNATFSVATDQFAESARILVKGGYVPKGATQIVRGALREVGMP